MPSLLNQLIYKETRKAFEDNSGVIFVNYNTFTQQDSVEIRSEAKKVEGTVRVVKNSVSIKALSDLGYEGVDGILQGPVLALFGDDAIGLAKVAAGFKKKAKKGDILGGLMDGAVVNADQVIALSKLPSKEVLIGQFVGVLAAPMRGLVTVLGGNIRGLAVALNAIKEKKEKEAA